MNKTILWRQTAVVRHQRNYHISQLNQNKRRTIVSSVCVCVWSEMAILTNLWIGIFNLHSPNDQRRENQQQLRQLRNPSHEPEPSKASSVCQCVCFSGKNSIKHLINYKTERANGDAVELLITELTSLRRCVPTKIFIIYCGKLVAFAIWHRDRDTAVANGQTQKNRIKKN